MEVQVDGYDDIEEELPSATGSVASYTSLSLSSGGLSIHEEISGGDGGASPSSQAIAEVAEQLSRVASLSGSMQLSGYADDCDRDGSSDFGMLPDDCVLSIFAHLPPFPTLFMLTRVSKLFRRVAHDARLWREVRVVSPRSRDHALLVHAIATRAPELALLSLSGCDGLTQATLSSVAGQCPLLGSLELSACPGLQLADVVSTVLALPSLQELAICSCGAGAGTEPPPAVSALRALQFQDCHASAEAIGAVLRACPQLQHLAVVGRARARLGPSLLQTLAECSAAKHLQTLRLGVDEAASLKQHSSMSGGDAGPAIFIGLETVSDEQLSGLLAACSGLRSLELCGLRSVRGDGLAAASTSLARVAIRGCSSLEGLPLPKMPLLESLEVQHCYSLNDSSIVETIAAAPLLSELSLEGCELVGGGVLTEVARRGSMGRLRALNLRGCVALDDAQLTALVAVCPDLSALSMGLDTNEMSFAMDESGSFAADLAGLCAVSDAGVESLTRSCPIVDLDMAGCAVGPNVMLALASARGTLEQLRLVHCPLLAAVPWGQEHGWLGSLGRIWLGDCPQLTDNDVGAIVASAPRLVLLHLDNCPLLTGQALLAVAKGAPHLAELALSRLPLVADDVQFTREHLALERFSVVECNAMTPVSALAVIVACPTVWSDGGVYIERSEMLLPLKVLLCCLCLLPCVVARHTRRRPAPAKVVGALCAQPSHCRPSWDSIGFGLKRRPRAFC